LLKQLLGLIEKLFVQSVPTPLASKCVVDIIECLMFHLPCDILKCGFRRGLFERHEAICIFTLSMRRRRSDAYRESLQVRPRFRPKPRAPFGTP
jgi:hypothetical protein